MDSNYTHFNDTTHVFKAYLTLYKVTDFIKLLFGTPVAVEPLATANDEPIYVASYNEQLAKRTWGDIKRAFFEFYDGDITKYLDRDNSTILECLHWLIVDDTLVIDGRLKAFLANLKIKDEQVASLPFNDMVTPTLSSYVKQGKLFRSDHHGKYSTYWYRHW